MPEIHPAYLLIETGPALEQLCKQLRDATWLALDTEFHRENSYYPRLCLLQVASETVVACIDPLRLTTLDPLLEILYAPHIVKVFHAGRQDQESFYHLRGKPLAPIFDTQIAAPLLGYPDQISYAALVQKTLGITLDKSMTRTDWRERPLSRQQLDYAANDVIYLGKVYRQFTATLEHQGRSVWLDEDFARLCDAAQYANPPATAWHRIKNVQRLNERQLAVLQALAGWREKTAEQENRPRNWVLNDELLLAMARSLPQRAADLATFPREHQRRLKHYGPQILVTIDQGLNAPPPGLPLHLQPHRRLKPAEEALINQLQEKLRQRCADNNIDDKAVAGRRELIRLLRGEKNLKILQGWRKRIVGTELQKILSGHPGELPG